MEIELLPCPFCGGKADIEQIGTRTQSCIVGCRTCGASHESADEYEQSGRSWNRRVAIAPVAEKPKLTLIRREQ